MTSSAQRLTLGVAALLAMSGTPQLASAGIHAPQYTLTIRHLDRSGAATADYSDTIVDRRTTDGVESSQDGDVTAAQVPAGQYLLDSIIGLAKGGAERSQLIRPQLDVSADMTITIDARQAKPVRISPPSPTVRDVRTVVDSNYFVNGRGYSTGISTLPDGPKRIYTAQVGPSVPGLSSAVRSVWAEPTGAGFDDTPVIYSLAWPGINGFSTGFTKAVDQRDLATLHPKLTAQAPGTVAALAYDAAGSDGTSGGSFSVTYRKLPAQPTVYVNTSGLTWRTSANYFTQDNGFSLSSESTTYQPGGTYADTIGRAVFGQAQGLPQFNSRTGNTLTVAPLQGDAAGHTAWTAAGHGSLVVRRNGTELVNLPYPFTMAPGTVDVPSGPADYQVEANTQTDAVLDLSTAVHATWGFRSDTVKAEKPLPLWTVAIRPAVDDKNVLRTGATHRLPVTASAPQGSGAGKLTTLTVQTSTDDGATWRAAPVQAGVATVSVPAGAQYVSVRTHVVDSVGNTFDQEIKRAYKVTPAA